MAEYVLSPRAERDVRGCHHMWQPEALKLTLINKVIFRMSDNIDPTEGQKLQEIEKYLRNTKENDEVAIRNTHAGILSFKIAKVTGTNPSSGRIYTDVTGLTGGRAWYMKHGKNVFHPTGQSRLFIATNEVKAFIDANPIGVMTYKTYSPD